MMGLQLLILTTQTTFMKIPKKKDRIRIKKNSKKKILTKWEAKMLIRIFKTTEKMMLKRRPRLTRFSQQNLVNSILTRKSCQREMIIYTKKSRIMKAKIEVRIVSLSVQTKKKMV